MHPHDPQTTHVKNIECADPQTTYNIAHIDPQIAIVLKCLKILVNLHLLFTHLAVVIAVFLYVSFSSVSPFPVVKRSGRPAGRHDGKLSI